MRRERPIRVAILFSGAGSNMEYILEQMQGRQIDVVLAVTDNPKAEGIEVASSHNIPCHIIESKDYESRESYDEAVTKELQQQQVELALLAGFMRILTPIFTDQIEAINLHPSLLPRHKGLRAIERSYQDSYQTGGVSLHWVSSELDSGDIIIQKEVSKKGLTLEQYTDRIKSVEKVAFVEAIKKVLNSDVL